MCGAAKGNVIYSIKSSARTALWEKEEGPPGLGGPPSTCSRTYLRRAGNLARDCRTGW
jgi:hypothetical protein